MAKRKKIAAILARVSRPTQSLESQVADLRRYADEHGYIVPVEFEFTEKITGINAGFKKSLSDLLAALDNPKNKIDAVLIWEITRLNRGAYDFARELGQISDRNVPVYFYDMDIWTWNFNTNQLSHENLDKLVFAANYGRLEWEKIANRTKRGRDDVARKGLYVGHLSDGYITVPEGSHKRIDVDDNRKGVIEKIFDLFIAGKSTDEIAQILNADNVPTANKYRLTLSHLNYNSTYKKKDGLEYNRNDTKWSGVQVSQVLSNKWYIGIRSYDGEQYKIPRIISDEKWEKAENERMLRASRFRSDRKKKVHNYLLSNYFYCGKLGRKKYGHVTGKDNHYYCSSVEEKNKCGLRGINKENVEAIVCSIIQYRALNEFIQGEGIMADFFKITEQEKRKLKQEIADKERDIKSKRNRLEELKRRKQNLYSMLADGDKDAKMIDEVLREDEKERTKIENELSNLQLSIYNLNKGLKIGRNAKKIVEELSELKDVGTYRKLIENTVQRIEIYNVDKSISYITIHYLNGEVDGFLYSYPLLKNGYIDLNPKLLNYFHMMYDGKSSEMLIEKGYYITFGFAGGGLRLLDDDGLKKELSKGPEWGFLRITNYYSGKISVRDFLLQARDTCSAFVRKYDNSIFIEETDERRAEQTGRYKEWRKKYNNGLPTTLPYVVRDGNYEEYVAQRKHLYNRKYKVKKNKRLTDVQKEEELERIDEALSFLKVKVKYLSREEAVQKYKKGKE